MKIFKRIFIGSMLYLIWKQVSFPFLIVGSVFFGGLLFKDETETGKNLGEARQELLREFGAWLNRVDPNNIVYAITILLAVVILLVMVRFQFFSRPRKKKEEHNNHHAGGHMIGEGRSIQVEGRVPENVIYDHDRRDSGLAI